jgi:Xaa-Pro dipeptidase
MTATPSVRHKALRDAESRATALFTEVAARQYIRPGISEKALNSQIYDLAFEMFGIRKYWHKRIVRSGPNTLLPYRENPPDLILQRDDIVFFDFGPVFEDWEADFGRTYVLGHDPLKHRLQREIEECWWLGKRHFDATPELTGAELFAWVLELCHARGWEYAQAHCGHLIGSFPHETVQGEEVENYIHPDNHQRMRDSDRNGAPRDWILEIHFIDRARQIGGFFEQLLTVE